MVIRRRDLQTTRAGGAGGAVGVEGSAGAIGAVVSGAGVATGGGVAAAAGANATTTYGTPGFDGTHRSLPSPEVDR